MNVMERLVQMEKFATGSEDVSAETVVKFYGSDFDTDLNFIVTCF